MLSLSVALANALLSANDFSDLLGGGLLYLYSGTPPANAGTVLDMVSTHTECLVVSDNDTGGGLNFDAATGGVLSKAATQAWNGTVAVSGFDASTTQTPTFFRFCADGDNGRAAADGTTGYRIQGSVGAVGSGADMQLATPTLTVGDVRGLGAFSLALAGG